MASINAIGGTGHAVLRGHAPRSLGLHKHPLSQRCASPIRRHA